MTGGNGNEIRAWRIGIHGARNTGKTCWLACLYGFRALPTDVVAFGDDGTIDYLKDKWERFLAKGETPQPNPKGLPTDLRCQLKADERVWGVVLRDYAGELTERKGGDDVVQLHDEIRDWLRSCDAILFLLDITETDEAARERLNELNLLLQELHKLARDGNRIARPLGLLLTKWDTRPDFDIKCAVPESESDKARCFLHHHPVFGQFFADLSHSGDRVNVFPVSAFGSHRNGHRPPATGPTSFNIIEPLKWSVTQSEEMVADKAEREAAQLTEKRWSRWRRYPAAIRVLHRAIRDHSLSKGVAHDRLSARLRTFQRSLVKLYLILLSVIACLAFVGTSGFLLWEEEGQYRSLVRAYGNPAVGPDGIRNQSDSYLQRHNPFKRLFGHEPDIRERWTTLQETASKQEFAALHDFRHAHSSDGEATKCSEKDQQFLESWGGSPLAAQVKGWKTDDDTKARLYESHIAHETRYRDLLADVAKLSNAHKYGDAEEAYHRFLRDYPQSSHREEINKRIEDMQTARDDSDWKKVVDLNQSNPHSYEDVIKAAHEYVVNPRSRHRAEAEALLTRTEDRWDAALYDDARNASRAGTDAHAVESDQRKALEYLSATQPRKRMKTEVQKWLDWFNQFQEERDYYVVVRSMQIPKGSNLEPSLSNPQCRILVGLNGREYWTQWQTGMEPVYGETLGPYRYKWGQSGTFAVQIQGYHPTWWKDNVYREPETDDRFILGRLNGPVSVRDSNGKEVIVYLECDALNQPSLPPYKDK